eukprot:g18591.t1
MLWTNLLLLKQIFAIRPKWSGLGLAGFPFRSYFMGNAGGVRLGCGPTSMCTGVGNCADWKNRQTSSDGLVLGPWGKNPSSTYEYPACGHGSQSERFVSGPKNACRLPRSTSTPRQHCLSESL